MGCNTEALFWGMDILLFFLNVTNFGKEKLSSFCIPMKLLQVKKISTALAWLQSTVAVVVRRTQIDSFKIGDKAKWEMEGTFVYRQCKRIFSCSGRCNISIS